MSINNKQLELYKKYFELFTNDENGEYTEHSSDIVEVELDDGLVTSIEDSNNDELNSKLKKDVEELKELIRSELKDRKINKDRLSYSLITREFYSKKLIMMVLVLLKNFKRVIYMKLKKVVLFLKC